MRRFNQQHKPSAVRQLRDWTDFVLKSTYLAFVDTVENALEGKLDQTAGDARYGRLGAGNSWSGTQSFAAIGGNQTFLEPTAGGVQLRHSVSGVHMEVMGGNVTKFPQAAEFGGGNFSGTRAGMSSTSSWLNALTLQGVPDQTAALLRFQQYSSTGTVRDASAIDTVWTDSTDATRTSAVDISTVDGGGALTRRLRIDADGLILKDRTTAADYRIYVDNGVLSVEAV